jgi:hypothetical protein
MPDGKQEWFKLLQTVIPEILVALLAASITALMSPDKPLMTRIRTFIAGVLFGVLLSLILRSSTLSPMWKDVFISGGAAFISTLWPILEKVFRHYTIKKTKDALPDLDND